MAFVQAVADGQRSDEGAAVTSVIGHQAGATSTPKPLTGPTATSAEVAPTEIPFQTDYEAGVGWTVKIFVG